MVTKTRFGCIAALLFCSTLAFAQSPQSQTYGAQDEIALVISAPAFTTWDSSTQTYAGPSARWVTNNNGCCLVAPVSLPSGALVIGIAIDGCNVTPAVLTGSFAACSVGNGCTASLPFATTSIQGCGRYRSDFTTPVTVNNGTSNYIVQFYHQGDTSGGANIYAMRVYYKLQVSPAPQTARYSDVPTTHAFFQYIEALAASGITAGCSATPPQYCPDAPLTRGQMAVFLARALGLHWVP